jgi:hypothetical protein
MEPETFLIPWDEISCSLPTEVSHVRQLQTCGLSEDDTSPQTDEGTSGTLKETSPIQARKLKSRSEQLCLFLGLVGP